MSVKITDKGPKNLTKALQKVAEEHLTKLVQEVAGKLRKINCPEHGPLAVTVIGKDVKSSVCCEPIQAKVDAVLKQYG